MLPPRAAATIGAFAALGCSGLLGIDDEQEDVVKTVCGCNGAVPTIDGRPCGEYVTKRLELATPATRSAWMKTFDQACSDSCDGNNCWKSIFGAPPVCKQEGESCVDASCAECCNFTPDGSTDCAGTT